MKSVNHLNGESEGFINTLLPSRLASGCNRRKAHRHSRRVHSVLHFHPLRTCRQRSVRSGSSPTRVAKRPLLCSVCRWQPLAQGWLDGACFHHVSHAELGMAANAYIFVSARTWPSSYLSQGVTWAPSWRDVPKLQSPARRLTQSP